MTAWGCWLIAGPGMTRPCWLKSYDPDHRRRYPTGLVTATADPAEAKRFASAGDVLAEWMRVSAAVPRRPDGRPNRPLSAFTIEPRRLGEGE